MSWPGCKKNFDTKFSSFCTLEGSHQPLDIFASTTYIIHPWGPLKDDGMFLEDRTSPLDVKTNNDAVLLLKYMKFTLSPGGF